MVNLLDRKLFYMFVFFYKSRGTSPFFPGNPGKAAVFFLKRTVVEKKGESTPRTNDLSLKSKKGDELSARGAEGAPRLGWISDP